MRSLLFEREQINCTCFDNSPKNGRLFKTQSFNSVNKNTKGIKQGHFRNQSQQGKNQKKSLKKQKPVPCSVSQKGIKQKDLIDKDDFISQIKIASGPNQGRKQHKVFEIGHIQSLRLQNLKTQRTKPAHNLRTARKPGLISLQPVNFQFNNKIPIFVEPERIAPHHQYQELVTQQFERDLREFKLHMEARQKEKHQVKINVKSSRQSLSANEISLKNIQSSHRTYHPDASIKISLQQIDKTPNRLSSHRNSAVSHRQKQSISKRIKAKMMPKQIQSEKDGSDSDSDNMSEVVGRGWEGLTEHRIQLEDLQEMIKKQQYNTQTNATQQSQIRNSQIKGCTESNSFIGPKNQNTKGLAFGGRHQYGATGISYQNIDYLGRTKIKSYTNINF